MPNYLKDWYLHFESESHFCFDRWAENLQEKLDEWLFEDTAICMSVCSYGVEPVRDNSWQVDILYESYLVNRLWNDGLAFPRISGRPQAQVGEHLGEVRAQMVLDEARVNLGVEVLHVQQVDQLLLWLCLCGVYLEWAWSFVYGLILVTLFIRCGQYSMALTR